MSMSADDCAFAESWNVVVEGCSGGFSVWYGSWLRWDVDDGCWTGGGGGGRESEEQGRAGQGAGSVWW